MQRKNHNLDARFMNGKVLITRIVSRIITYFQFVLVQGELRQLWQSLKVIVICFFQFDYILLDRRSVKINPHNSQLLWSDSSAKQTLLDVFHCQSYRFKN